VVTMSAKKDAVRSRASMTVANVMANVSVLHLTFRPKTAAQQVFPKT
jgi:hypothetical protein